MNRLTAAAAALTVTATAVVGGLLMSPEEKAVVEPAAAPSAEPSPTLPPIVITPEPPRPPRPAPTPKEAAKPAPKPKPAPPAPVALPAETVALVTANIKTSMGPGQFEQDYSKVLAFQPDFIALQEVSRRPDSALARNGYEIYRSHESAVTAETPVLWNGHRWELVDAGTVYLTERQVKWGVRAVNWATVKSRTTGRVVSVVSAHPAPTTKLTEGLLPIFVQRLHSLTDQLAASGEVLVAGDMNVGYQGALWQRAGLPSSPLRSTYDRFGRLPGGTGDHAGATIDYMMGYGSDTLTPTAQGKWEQESDHDALWSTWELSASGEVMPDLLPSLVLSPLK